MDTAARAAGIKDATDPNADPSRDVELGRVGHKYSTSQNPSRASLPLSHQRSLSLATSRRRNSTGNDGRPSTTSGRDAQQQEEPDPGNDAEWGPHHPCFPHLNPHVPVDSPEYQSTRIIRIKRDWVMVGDLAPTFLNLYPEILSPYLAEDRFWDLIKMLNLSLINIFNPWSMWAWIDAIMGFITGWLWDDFGLTRAKKELAKLEREMEQWNKQFGYPEGIRVIPLRRTGFLCLDIEIPDPKIGPEGDDASSTAGTSRMLRKMSRRSKMNVKTSAYTPSQPGTAPLVPSIPDRYLDSRLDQRERDRQKNDYEEVKDEGWMFEEGTQREKPDWVFEE